MGLGRAGNCGAALLILGLFDTLVPVKAYVCMDDEWLDLGVHASSSKPDLFTAVTVLDGVCDGCPSGSEAVCCTGEG